MKLFAVVWIVFFLSNVLRILTQIFRNMKSPVVTVLATVIDKKETIHKMKNGQMTSYFVCFQTAEGVPLELQLYRDEYDRFVIGNRGLLTHQGMWYKGFTHEMENFNYKTL